MRLVIAEDDPLLREGIAALLTAEGLEVMATAGDADGLLAAVANHTPDVAVVDVRMPPSHTDEGIRAAVEAPPANQDWPYSSCQRTSNRPSPPNY